MPNIRSRHIRYRRTSPRPPLSFWLVLIAALALGAFAAFILMRPATVSQHGVRSIWTSALGLATSAGQQAAPDSKGQIFPYSIVAGGVHNKQQFEAAMRTDPVAAAHYASFDAAKFHVVKLQHAEEAYVSFRVGDNVYWTSHKVTLRKGETLISDGKHLGRTRCGNRVSETPRLPTYNHEPSEAELNTTAQPHVETEAFTAQSPLAPGTGALPATALAPTGITLSGPGPRQLASTLPPSYTPFLGTPNSPPLGCTNGSVDSNGKCVVPTTPGIPNMPTPENSARVLFFTGVVLLAANGLIRRRRAGMA
ncbi:MAG: hypothetical protein ACRD11_03505 [Terriglobia bacterium]